MITIENLLEQHDHYDLGDGWTIGRREREWHVYFRAKHVDCWDAEATGEPCPDPLNGHPTAIAAIRFCQSIRYLNLDWMTQ